MLISWFKAFGGGSLTIMALHAVKAYIFKVLKGGVINDHSINYNFMAFLTNYG